MTTLAQRFWAKVILDVGDACWLWVGSKNRAGYGKMYTGVRSTNGHPVADYAHHVAWELANGTLPQGQWVLHRCDNPRCVRPDHLFLGTSQDNVDDMHRKRRHAYGARVHGKLSDGAVLEILAAPGTQRMIAQRFGVSQPQVSFIKTGRQWKHVQR